MPDVPQLKTRRPTGKPPWPMIVVAGAEKTGKSWCGAQFSASDLIDRTFWVEIGEGAADQYGALPGARYEIVEHDGTYRGIGSALWAATRQPRGEDGKPHAIVVDGVTALWDMISDEAQGIANVRAKKAAEAKGRKVPVGDRTITTDLWNGAKKRWARIIDMLRKYDGPVVLLARLELVTVMKGDTPTTEKTWKIRAEKNLPHEADAVVRFTAPRKAELTGVRSVVLQLEPGEATPLPDFTVDALLRELGLGEPDATAPRSYTAPLPVWMEAEADIERDTATPKEQAQERHQERRQQRRATERAAQFPPDAARPQPTEVRQAGASTSVQNKLLGLIEHKIDITDREEQMRWISAQLRRHVATPDQLGVSDAMGLIRRLEDTTDRAQPWDEQPQVPPPDDAEPTAAELYAALDSGDPEVEADAAAILAERGLPAEPSGPPAAVSWSHQMLEDRGTPLTDDQRARVVADTIEEIGAAETEKQLGEIGARAQEAYRAKRLRTADVNLINQAYARQMRELRGRVGAGA